MAPAHLRFQSFALSRSHELGLPASRCVQFVLEILSSCSRRHFGHGDSGVCTAGRSNSAAFIRSNPKGSGGSAEAGGLPSLNKRGQTFTCGAEELNIGLWAGLARLRAWLTAETALNVDSR